MFKIALGLHRIQNVSPPGVYLPRVAFMWSLVGEMIQRDRLFGVWGGGVSEGGGDFV